MCSVVQLKSSVVVVQKNTSLPPRVCCHGNLMEEPRSPMPLAVVQCHEEWEGQRSSTAVVEVAGLRLEAAKMLQSLEGLEPRSLEEKRYACVPLASDPGVGELERLGTGYIQG